MAHILDVIWQAKLYYSSISSSLVFYVRGFAVYFLFGLYLFDGGSGFFFAVAAFCFSFFFASNSNCKASCLSASCRANSFLQKGWIITSPDKILSKYVLFELTDANLPLQLYKIILGPNCPEANLNRRQLEVLLHEQGITHITVENSDIISYRKN